MTSSTIDPTKTPDEIVEDIEAAEEAKDEKLLLAFLGHASSDDRGGDDDWSEVAEAALDALYRLIKGGSIEELKGTSLVAEKMLAKIFVALSAWKEEEAIVEVALGCIVAISSHASDSDGARSRVPVELVVELLRSFGDEATIQEQACLAIEGLALWKTEWKLELKATEGIREELALARSERITNERNKSYPLRAASALGIDNLE